MSLEVLLQAAEYIERKEREMEHGYASSLPIPSAFTDSISLHGRTPIFTSHKPPRRPRNNKAKSTTSSTRTIHNELEKNRRAHLRTCLEKLKEMVPVGPDGSKHTTLGLLTKARQFIQNLEERHRRQSGHKESLIREQQYMRRKLSLLTRDLNVSPSSSFEEILSESYLGEGSDSAYGSLEDTKLGPRPKSLSARYDIRNNFGLKRRSVSESSGFSTESNSSTGTSYSESDEGDILGGELSPPTVDGDDSDEVSSNRSSFSLSSRGSVVLSTRKLTLKEEIVHARNSFL